MNTETINNATLPASLFLSADFLAVIKELKPYIETNKKLHRENLSIIEVKRTEADRGVLTYTEGHFLVRVTLFLPEGLPALFYVKPINYGAAKHSAVLARIHEGETYSTYAAAGWQVEVLCPYNNYVDYSRILTDAPAELAKGRIGINPDYLSIFPRLAKAISSAPKRYQPCVDLSFHGQLGTITVRSSQDVTGVVMPMKLD